MKDRYIATIYKGLIQNKSVESIHSDLYEQTINSDVKSTNMLLNVYKITNKLKKRLPSTQNAVVYAQREWPQYKNEINSAGVGIAMILFKLIGETKVDQRLKQNIYEKINKDEGESKEKALIDMLETNRQLVRSKVFYLASSHNDSASDHKDYQGKMYFDDKWQTTVTDKQTKKLISDYIQKNHLLSVQWVTHKPVWFITRPNCRHYFKALDTSVVLENSIAELKRRYKTNRAVGDREYLQTMKSPKNRKLTGEKRNAELMIEKYYERLATHKELYKSFKSILVKEAINKDLMLINKWKSYLNTLNA